MDSDPNRASRFQLRLSDVHLTNPPCITCAHFNGRRSNPRCAAFGDEPIPQEIWLGNHIHSTPYPGDNGIQYRLKLTEV